MKIEISASLLLRNKKKQICPEECKRFFAQNEICSISDVYFYKSTTIICIILCFTVSPFYHLADSCEIANKKSNLTNALFDVSLTVRNHTNQAIRISYILAKHDIIQQI